MVKNRLGEILDERGIKQIWLAEQVGITRQTMSNLVKNRYNTSAEVGLKIAFVLNLSFDDIFYLD
ncbi:MAG TPA: helix-turn-helix domain-containing protein [Clostridium sp.]